jgi:hypothetical protein
MSERSLNFGAGMFNLLGKFATRYRIMLDPALATFFGKWTWWPGGVQGKVKSESVDGLKPAIQGGD